VISWLVNPDFDSPGLQQWLADPQRLTTAPATLLYRTAHPQSNQLYRLPFAAVNSGAVIVKRFPPPTGARRWKQFFRRSHAWRAFRKAETLCRLGIPTPTPIAAGEVRLGLRLQEAWLLTEAITPTTTLTRLLADQRRLPRETVRRVARLLARLHDCGFSQRDLKATNLMLDGHQQPWLIDLDGLRYFWRLPAWRALGDLGRLAREFVDHPRVLRWDARRLLKEYCRARGRIAEFRPWNARIARRLARHKRGPLIQHLNA